MYIDVRNSYTNLTFDSSCRKRKQRRAIVYVIIANRGTVHDKLLSLPVLSSNFNLDIIYSPTLFFLPQIISCIYDFKQSKR
jgi:hypothetical protein